MERGGSIQLDIPDFSNSVLSHLNQLRIQGRLCDIVVNVQGQSFRAHKVVLAASSPYFRDHMSLGEMSTVSLSVIRNPSVFEQLLSFCYTGRLCLQLADIISYLTAASFLQMQHIIDRCTQILEAIHFKINLADVDGDLVGSQGGSGRTLESGSLSGGPVGTHLISPRLCSSPKMTGGPCGMGGVAAMEAGNTSEQEEVSPAGNSMSPQIVEHSGMMGSEGGKGGAGSMREKEPVLRINRAGQWYVESGLEDRGEESVVRVPVGLRIKTEHLEDWGSVEVQASAADISGAEEEDGVAPMMIDASGRSSMVQEEFVSGASGPKSAQPSSSFSETDRFSPTGSVVVMAERQRAKSESPGRVYDQKHSSSQGEEQAMYDMGGYEEYLREQVGDRWFRYNPRLTCIYCCKSFNQKGSLDRHMRLHMGITPFVCRICGKKYTRKDQLEYHIRKHTGNKPFHCHVCGKSFPFQAILNQHLRKNHPGCTSSTSQEAAHSASPETTTTTVTSRGGQADDESPGQEEMMEGKGAVGGGGGPGSQGEGMQSSVSTTGPD